MELPDFVQIEPVGQCNLRCQMCPIQFRQDGPPYGPPAFMPFETFTRLIDQFGAIKQLHLQGLGEPLMHPRFFEMVRYATARGVRVTTNTNLTLLNKQRAAECVTSGLETIYVSIDGATAQTYERIRVRAHFDRVMNNLQLLLQAREGHALPHLWIVMVIMRNNLSELPALVKLAKEWQAEGLSVQHLAHDFQESSLPAHYRAMRDFVQAETLLEEDPRRVDYYFSAARAVAEELQIELRLPSTQRQIHPPGTPGRDRCNWPWTGAYISYEGLAMPCCMVATPDRSNFGNMAEHGVEAIWSGSPYEDFRARLASDNPPEICQSCSVYWGTF